MNVFDRICLILVIIGGHQKVKELICHYLTMLTNTLVRIEKKSFVTLTPGEVLFLEMKLGFV